MYVCTVFIYAQNLCYKYIQIYTYIRAKSTDEIRCDDVVFFIVKDLVLHCVQLRRGKERIPRGILCEIFRFSVLTFIYTYIHIYIHAFIQIFKTYIHICAHTLNIKIREPVLWIIDSGSSMNLIFIRSCFFDSGTDDALVVVVGGGCVFAEGNAIRIGFVFAFAAAYVD